MQNTTTRTGAGSVATDETDRLIASNKVEGTAVYNRQGDRLGDVYNGESYHPLPWRVLNYDTGMGGYVVDLDKDRLRGAPSFSRDQPPDWSDRNWGTRVHDYYGVRPYWGP